MVSKSSRDAGVCRPACVVGGSAVPEALIRAFARHGVQIVQGWGMTETSPVATVSYLTSALAAVSEDERVRRSAMVGLPVPLVELRLRSDAGRDAACDGSTMGEVQVRGPFITGAYHEVGVSPESFTEDGWLRTGDVATQDGQGYLRITDRTKDLIKSGGEWISSVALENALMSHPAVVEAAVIAIPHERWGERPLACVVFKPGSCDWQPRRLSGGAGVRALAMPGTLRADRRGAAHIDGQVLETEAA